FDADAKRQGATQTGEEPARQALAQGHQVVAHDAFAQADDAGQQRAEGDDQSQMQQAQGKAQSGHEGLQMRKPASVYRAFMGDASFPYASPQTAALKCRA